MTITCDYAAPPAARALDVLVQIATPRLIARRWENSIIGKQTPRRVFGIARVTDEDVANAMALFTSVVTARQGDEIDDIMLVVSALQYAVQRLTHAGDRRVVEDEARVDAATMRHMVYRLSDASGQLLYVGITNRGPVRLAEHYRHKPWFRDVVSVVFERYATRHESMQRERDLIVLLRPTYNIQHNTAVTRAG